jgi:cysteinyl-tRNA synthetase
MEMYCLQVDTFENYGQLSGKSLEDLIAGSRVEVADYKKNSADFILWKPSKENEPGWDSPWGKGRPDGTLNAQQ